MSNYHITQEQVREIRDALINTSIINSNTSALEDSTNIVNAVLDKVLGEPVAYRRYESKWGEYRYYETKWGEYRYIAKPNKHRACEALYAPKELP